MTIQKSKYLFSFSISAKHVSKRCSSTSFGEGNGNPLQYSCLENPRDGGAWWAAVYGVTQSRTRLKRLSSSSSTNLHSEQQCIKCSPSTYGVIINYKLLTRHVGLLTEFLQLKIYRCKKNISSSSQIQNLTHYGFQQSEILRKWILTISSQPHQPLFIFQLSISFFCGILFSFCISLKPERLKKTFKLKKRESLLSLEKPTFWPMHFIFVLMLLNKRYSMSK